MYSCSLECSVGELEGLKREGGGERPGFFGSGVTLAATRRFAVLVSERRKGSEEGGGALTPERSGVKVGRSSFSFSFWSWRIPSSIALACAPIPVASLSVWDLSLSDISILISSNCGSARALFLLELGVEAARGGRRGLELVRRWWRGEEVAISCP